MGPEWEGEEVTMPYYDRIHRDFAMQNVNTAQFMHISMQETSYFDVWLFLFCLILEPFFAIRKLVYFSGHDSKSLWKHSEAEFGCLAREACSEVPHNHQTATFEAQLDWLSPLSSTIDAWRLYGDLGQDLPCKAQVFFWEVWAPKLNSIRRLTWTFAYLFLMEISILLHSFVTMSLWFVPPRTRKNSFVNSDSILTLAMGCYSQRIGAFFLCGMGFWLRETEVNSELDWGSIQSSSDSWHKEKRLRYS